MDTLRSRVERVWEVEILNENLPQGTNTERNIAWVTRYMTENYPNWMTITNLPTIIMSVILFRLQGHWGRNAFIEDDEWEESNKENMNPRGDVDQNIINQQNAGALKFKDFVKKHYNSVRHLPVKERFGALSKMRKSGKY